MAEGRILITGETGYAAQHLWADRQARGMAADLLSVRGDAWRESYFAGYDAVIHAAALVHAREAIPWETWEAVNVTLTRALAEKAKREGVRTFVFLSTLAVYSAPPGGLRARHVIDKKTPTDPGTPYGKSKLLAEEALFSLEDVGFSVLIIRCPMIYGKSCPGNYGTLRRLALRLPVLPRHDNARAMLHIDTLCGFVAAALSTGLRGVYVPQDANPVCTVNMMQAIRTRNGKGPLPQSRLLGALLPLAARVSGKVDKAFGNLTVDPALSDAGQRYQTNDFDKRMDLTEPWDEEAVRADV